MKNKRYWFLLLLMGTTMVFSGCWNYVEIDKLAIVAGMAVDKNPSGQYLLTIEIIDLLEGDKEYKVNAKTLEANGETLFDAIRNAIKISGNKLYWGHTEVVVISQEVAEEGIVDIVDWLDRDAEPRLNVDLLVSKGKTARELYNSQIITSEVHSYEVNSMLDSQKSLSKASRIQVYQFINALAGDGISPVLPVVRLTKNGNNQAVEMSGTAVFKGDKLIGFLEDNETKYFMFIRNKISGGLQVVNEASEKDHANIALEILGNKTKVKPVYSNGRLTMEVEFKTRVALAENSTRENYTKENDIRMLEKTAEDLVEENTKNVIKRVQEEYDVDIFGFGSIVKEEMPSLWKKIHSDWDTMFKHLDVKVKSTVEIENSALLSKPVKVGDNR